MPQYATDESDSSPKQSSSQQKTVDYRKLSYTDNNSKIMQLIEELPENSKEITMDDVLNFYETIKGTYLISPMVIRHRKFDLIREVTDAHLSQFTTKELSNILVAVLPSKRLMNDNLGQMIVNANIDRVKRQPFNIIVFNSFILHKYYSVSEMNKECILLRSAFQRQFLSQIEEELNNLNDFNELMKIVAFCINNSEVITPKITNLLTTMLLLNDDDKFTTSDILTCFNILALCAKLNGHVVKLLHKMVDLWCKSDVTASQVRVLLKILSANRNTIDKEQFNDSKLIGHCVNVVASEQDRKLLFSIQNEFNRLVS